MRVDRIDYPTMIDNAMRSVVRDTLRQVRSFGLPGDHHFFISFKTNAPGVKVSEHLRTRYPEELTVVLQHQFSDLRVEESFFSVTLSFGNMPEKLVVPYAAITAFADPSVKFGLQFHNDEAGLPSREQPLGSNTEEATLSFTATREEPEAAKSAGGAEIITLDTFRKK